MYSFGPVPKSKKTGRVVGAHQKIDRVARRHLTTLVDERLAFPTTREILHFEGYNGPDGVKMKSPGRDEPWHFIDPEQPSEQFLAYLREHSANLTDSLVRGDHVRAAFEASWLAHVVVDGLTPAHHEPLEAERERIRGVDADKIQSVREKLVMPGRGSAKQFVVSNWQYWGAGGVMTTHMMFEAGVATTMKPLNFETARPDKAEIERVLTLGFEKVYLEMLARIAELEMYADFKKSGWTQRMARLTKDTLVPTIIQAVVLAWYAAYHAALEKKQ